MPGFSRSRRRHLFLGFQGGADPWPAPGKARSAEEEAFPGDGLDVINPAETPNKRPLGAPRCTNRDRRSPVYRRKGAGAATLSWEVNTNFPVIVPTPLRLAVPEMFLFRISPLDARHHFFRNVHNALSHELLP